MLAFVLEGGLTFVVLYSLAVLTLAVSPGLQGVTPGGYSAATSVLFLVCLHLSRGTTVGDGGSLRREVALTSIVSLQLGLLTYLVYWAFSGSPRILPAVLMLEGAFAVPAAVAAWRWVAVRYSILDGWRERILVLGTGESARNVCRWITESRSSDYVVTGFADEDSSRHGEVLSMGIRILTDFAHLGEFCPKRADRIVVALEEKRGKLPLEELMELRLRGTQIEDATTFLERTSGKLVVETMLPSWLIFSEGFKTSMARLAVKRASDIVVSAILVALSSPIMALVAILIKLDTHGKVFYRQKRMGRNGFEFELTKFRSMVKDAESRTGPTWASENDPRVTRVGAVLRKLRIDELPQLFNVLRGEMSFVGPRPERKHFVRQLEHQIPYYRLRHALRPGITGWAQVQYGYGSTVQAAQEKLKYDLYYVKNASLLFDIWIMIKTIKVVLRGSGAR